MPADRLSRRALAAAGLAALLPARASASRPPRVVALDFGLAETLLEVGIAPVGLPARDDWADWVVEPALPPGIVDLGSALDLNVELLSELAPDHILATPYQAGPAAIYRRIAPVTVLPVYDAAGAPLERSREAALAIARLAGDEARGAALVVRTEAVFAAARARLAGADGRPCYFVNFLDQRHVRVYGAKSLFQDVLDRIGVANAWARPTNDWGFATAGIEELATTADARLFYLEPAHEFARLSRGPLWRSLGFVRSGLIERLPPILMFGTLPSAARFARIVAARLAPDGPSRG